MASKIALQGGAYQARSVAAAAQRCCNLFAEPMPQAQGEPMPAAYYQTPGTRRIATVGSGPIRGIRQCTNGGTYVVSASGVYVLNPTGGGDHLGDITAGLTTPVSMAENGLQLVVVDGTTSGWYVDLSDSSFHTITDPAFLGADRVEYLDTFFVFNKRGTQIFYWSLSMGITFDALDFVAKSSNSDLLMVAAVAHRNIYAFGTQTTEIFDDVAPTSPTDSQFVAQPNVIIDHGTCAKYSVAVFDNSILWLTRDRQGQGLVFQSMGGYQTKEVSTLALGYEWSTYARIDDAIGFCWQLAGHSFYTLCFPTADKTWLYDIGTGHWAQWVWIDVNGDEHRHRANCYALFNGLPVVGDHTTGALYALDNSVFTDWDGLPIKRVRSFPHIEVDNRRVFHRELVAAMQTGTAHTPVAGASNSISLRWSDDRGNSWGSPVTQPIGANGNYLNNLQWQRLGLARSRVYEISWSVPLDTSLQGCYLTVEAADADAPSNVKQDA